MVFGGQGLAAADCLTERPSVTAPSYREAPSDSTVSPGLKSPQHTFDRHLKNDNLCAIIIFF